MHLTHLGLIVRALGLIILYLNAIFVFGIVLMFLFYKVGIIECPPDEEYYP